MASIPQALRLDGESLGRLAASAPRWVTGLLVVLIGVQLAWLATSRAPVVPQASAAAPAAVRNEVDLPSILRANLFGKAASPAVDGANAPITNLALVLTGVVAATKPENGFAVLGPSATATRLYAVGSVLPGGATLRSVYADRVLLDRGGAVEALMLPKRNTAGVAPPPPPAANNNALERVQQLVRDHPGIIGEIIRPQAVMADGKQRGYRVYPGPNQQAFNRLGLRPGDLVTAINGTTLDDPNRGGEVFSTLASVAEARITVVRNGSSQDLALNLADVANEAEKLTQLPAGGPDAAAGPVAQSPAAR
ncbi:MAG: type II secretion system protein GspC [Steroidobacteraceae bacterium]